MIKSIKDRRAAMEMSVGTIVTIVLLMAVLVLGLTLTRTIFRGATESVNDLNSGVKKEINNLFGEEDKNLVIALGSQKTADVKQGTNNFGIPMGFSPDNPNSWGKDMKGCSYSIDAINQPNYCINKGWANPEASILTGVNKVDFDEVQDGNGYALIKINIPEKIPPCLQRFEISVGCNAPYNDEAVKTYFDIEVIKRGLF
jgi:hypothetical protein